MREVTFSDSNMELVVLPDLGARIHRLRYRGHDLLRTPQDPLEHERDPFYWGAYVMAPWCNRLRAVEIPIGTPPVHLPQNFPDGSAIHGQVYAAPWSQVDEGTFRIESGGRGWPWRYAVTERISLGGRSVVIELSVINLADDSMPAGVGLHPWFVGRIELSIDADLVYPTNIASPPEPVPVSGNLDARRRIELAVGVDATWPAQSDAPVELWWPDVALHCVMRVDAPQRVIVAANPGDRGAIAVEPETHAPQGLRRLLNDEPDGLSLLDPGEALTMKTELRFD